MKAVCEWAQIHVTARDVTVGEHVSGWEACGCTRLCGGWVACCF